MNHNPFAPTQAEFKLNKRDLSDLLTKSESGYRYSKGIHIYAELRFKASFEAAKDDKSAQKYLVIVQKLITASLAASRVQNGATSSDEFPPYLIEVQGTVLHFYIEAELSTASIVASLAFAFAFTRILYDQLRDDVGEAWDGFAVCMAHGPAILVRCGNDSAGSLVSLGPAANAPAKRLLHGRTPAGVIEFPCSWANALGLPSSQGEWVQINARDEIDASFLRKLPIQATQERLVNRISEALKIVNRGQVSEQLTLNAKHADIELGRFSPDKPHRTQAFALQADFDGFSKIIEAAFKSNDLERIRIVAEGFYALMQFAQTFEDKTEGAIRLPWAGDRITFLFESLTDLQRIRGGGWVRWTEAWQSFGSHLEESKSHRWDKLFPDVKWGIGLAFGTTGSCLLALVQGEERQFLVASGWPVAMSLDAQNLAKGDEVVIPNEDYAALYPEAKKLFRKHPESDKFWVSEKLTKSKIQKSAIAMGAAAASPTISISEKLPSIIIPPPRHASLD